jgi:hypothetical protein
MLGAVPDRRSAGERPAPCRHPQRSLGAAAHHGAHRVRRAAAPDLGVAHFTRQAQNVRQRRRASAQLRRHHARSLDAAAVRPDGELEGRRMDPLALARKIRC